MLNKTVVALLILVRLALAAGLLALVNVAPHSTAIRHWLEQGDRAAREGRYEDSAAAYSRLAASAAQRPAAYERLLRLSLAAGWDGDARAYLYALADWQGWTPERRDLLRAVLEREGQDAQAALLLGPSAGTADSPPGLWSRLARQRLADQDWRGARAALEQWLAQEPENPEALYLLGLLVAPDDPRAASDLLTRAASDPAWAGRAQTVLTALAAYQTASLTDAHTALGVALVGLGEWAFAERALQRAVDVYAVNPEALAYLGYTRDQQGRDGLPDLQAALDMAPNDPTVYYFLGQHWRMLDDQQAAYDAFSQAYLLAPQNPALAAEVGASLQRLGDLAGAEEWLRVAVQLAPQDVRWVEMLAAFYADLGYQLDGDGLAAIEQAVRDHPDSADLHASLGWARYKLGDLPGAYDELSRAVGLNAGHLRARYYFGVVLEAMGDREGAQESYRYVAEQGDPGQGFGLLALRALQRLG